MHFTRVRVGTCIWTIVWYFFVFEAKKEQNRDMEILNTSSYKKSSEGQRDSDCLHFTLLNHWLASALPCVSEEMSEFVAVVVEAHVCDEAASDHFPGLLLVVEVCCGVFEDAESCLYWSFYRQGDGTFILLEIDSDTWTCRDILLEVQLRKKIRD